MKGYIGRYRLGTRDVELYWKRGTGGSFDSATKDRGIGRVNVGIDEKEWPLCINALTHEAFEMAAMDFACRFNPTPDYAFSHASYIFVMTHEQMAEIIGRVTYFLSGALPALSAAYKKHREHNDENERALRNGPSISRDG